ncbi:hypothetical protein [Pseudomonas tolaasii]|uniref:hypothetical protein n=1 Tax=Pseudomonas tolaasii TaxID=29442 RepID=UPI00211B282E|nr:hypothetical protein [Pseudomonas tolaasii]
MNGKVSTKVFIIGIPPTLASVQIQNVVDPAIGLVSKASATSSLELDCPSGDQSDNGDWYEVYMRDKTSPIANAWTQIAGPAQFTIANPGDLFRVTIPAPAGSGGFPHGNSKFVISYLLISLRTRPFRAMWTGLQMWASNRLPCL